MGLILISQSNLMEASGVAVTSGQSVASGLPLTNLATRLLSEACRFESTTFAFSVDLQRNRSITLVALQAHSGSRTARWRIRMGRTVTAAEPDDPPDDTEGETLLFEDGGDVEDEDGADLTDEQPVAGGGGGGTPGALDVLYDSGWLYVWPRTVTFGSRPFGDFPADGREVVAGGNTALHLPSEAQFMRYVLIDVDDPDSTAAYWDIGRLLLDAPWRPTINLEIGYETALIDRSEVADTFGGQPWVDRRPVQRELRFSVGMLSKDEMLPQALDRALAEGVAVPMFVIVDPDDTKHRHREMVYGLCRELSGPVNQTDFEYRKSWAVRESLA